MKVVILSCALVAAFYCVLAENSELENVLVDSVAEPEEYYLQTEKEFEEIPVNVPLNVPRVVLARFLQALQEKETNTKALAAEINKFTDILLANIKNFMIHNGFDPTELPDIHEKFEYKPLWITYHGELDLTKGWLQELSTISRSGDAIISYDKSKLTISLPLGFKDLQFNYAYSAKFMNIGPKGGIDGNVKSMRISVVIDLDLKNFKIILTKFKITNAGKINFKFRGNILTDWVANLFTKVITTVLHNTVVKITSNIIGGQLEKTINTINNQIENILKPNA